MLLRQRVLCGKKTHRGHVLHLQTHLHNTLFKHALVLGCINVYAASSRTSGACARPGVLAHNKHTLTHTCSHMCGFFSKDAMQSRTSPACMGFSQIYRTICVTIGLSRGHHVLVCVCYVNECVCVALAFGGT